MLKPESENRNQAHLGNISDQVLVDRDNFTSQGLCELLKKVQFGSSDSGIVITEEENDSKYGQKTSMNSV